MKVPFCVLLKSIHEKVHNQFLNIPMEMCHGDYKFFMKEYYAYLSEDEQEIISAKLKINKDNCGWKVNNYNWIQKV
jgi:uncharacterized iron-regulated protein